MICSLGIQFHSMIYTDRDIDERLNKTKITVTNNDFSHQNKELFFCFRKNTFFTKKQTKNSVCFVEVVFGKWIGYLEMIKMNSKTKNSEILFGLSLLVFKQNNNVHLFFISFHLKFNYRIVWCDDDDVIWVENWNK